MRFLRRLLLTVLLVLPLTALGADFSASLSSYDPASTSWSLLCAVGTDAKTPVGSADIGAPIAFTMGAPEDEIHCVAQTAKGIYSSPLSDEVTVKIPLVLSKPVLQVDLQ